jgi:hypothetical protein
MYVAPLLSHHKAGGCERRTLSSLNKDRSHVTSAVAMTKAQFSALVLEHEIVWLVCQSST